VSDDGTALSRRNVLALIAAVPAAAALPGAASTSPVHRGPAGTASDPVLTAPVRPWPLVLSEAERHTVASLCDLILPADERSPAASALEADEFVDEWVSAPYPRQREDLATLRNGLAWLERAARSAGASGFSTLDPAMQTALCETICFVDRAAPDVLAGALMFALVRNLAATAVWTTPEGMADLGYVGNVPLAHWGPPPTAVLRHVGLTDTGRLVEAGGKADPAGDHDG
jgi:hypothetical protein